MAGRHRSDPLEAAPTSDAPRPPAKPASMAGVPGRWIRVLPTQEPGAGAAAPTPEREVDDPAEAAAVRAGWLLVDAYERMSGQAATRVFGHENNAWHEYAASTVVSLEAPADSTMAHIHESRNNTLRYRRTMDFAREGDRIFDVGFGHGYLAAQLILGRRVASYDAIDIIDSMKATAEKVFAANGLGDAPIRLAKGNLYDLTRDRLEGTGTNLVICCEVLEHVPDPERALRVLADALPDDADLVFSVPLHGRLENVWGHLSVFDVARLKDMLDLAGLHAHHVEPLANTWTLVVANRDPAPSTRVRQAAGRPRTRVSAPLTVHRDFVDVTPAQLNPTPPSSTGYCQIGPEPDDEREVRCLVTGRGGVTFPVTGLEALRLVVKFHEVDSVERIVVTARHKGSKAARWVWEPEAGDLTPGLRTFSLRPGQWSRSFIGGAHKGLPAADKVNVVIEQPSDEQASFSLRVAYLP